MPFSGSAASFRLLSALLVLAALLLQGEPTAGRRLADTYGSVPKGLVLEGTAAGFEKINSISYDRENNRFLLNRSFYYNNPVGENEMCAILNALAKDDRIGVSFTPNGKVLVYGQLPREHQLVQTLADADRILVSAVFGWERNLRGVTFPDNWRPLSAPTRAAPMINVNKLQDYVFARSGDTYYRVSLSMINLLVPMSGRPAADGGFAEGTSAQPEPTDRENLDFLRSRAKDVLKIPPLKKAAAAGEAAAFARLLRDQGKLNLRDLAAHISRAR